MPDEKTVASSETRLKLKRLVTYLNNLFTWKVILFISLLAVSIILGLRWKAFGAPPTPVDQYSAPPQQVEVYVSDPGAKVTLTANVLQQADAKKANIYYYLSIIPSSHYSFVDWLVITDGISSLDPQLYNKPIYDGYSYKDRPITEQVFQGDSYSLKDHPMSDDKQLGYLIGGTEVPEGVLTSGGGELFAHLPEVASEDRLNDLSLSGLNSGISTNLQPQWYHMAVLLEKSHANFSREAIIESPQPIRTLTQSDNIPDSSLFPALVKEPFYEPFYVPDTIYTNVIMNGLASTLQDGYRIDYTYPSNYRFSGSSVIWSGDLSLSPIILATNVDAEQTRANYDFLAGIALAVAAAAFIALIQEIKPQGTSDKAPDPDREAQQARQNPPPSHPEPPAPKVNIGAEAVVIDHKDDMGRELSSPSDHGEEG